MIKLISQRPAADRSAMAGGKSLDRSRLQSDSAPLRDLYKDGKDKTLLTIISDYFSVVKELLWHDQPSKSFIVRTVGVLALFDLLRDALLANRVNQADVRGSTKSLLLGAKGIDFSDDFFHASGAGRVRIRNVLAYVTGLPGSFVPQVIDAAERLRLDRK